MKVQGATISLEGRKFAVVLVRMEVVGNPGEADMAIEKMQPAFGGVPVILMAQNDAGTPTYYGDQDLVRSMADIPFDKMPWKEYTIA